MSTEPGRSPIALKRPSIALLPAYVAALNAGWSPDNVLGKAAADRQLARIEQDPQAFVDSLYDPEARGAPIPLPDGGVVPRLPGFVSWIWDGEFCGSIGFRWAPDGLELPAHVLGHIGYAVVPWKQNRGCATAALGLLLPEARARGLAYVDLTTDPGNMPSQRVILSNGGELAGPFRKPAQFGGAEGLRFRIFV
jgi:predicted acetyltransferase